MNNSFITNPVSHLGIVSSGLTIQQPKQNDYNYYEMDLLFYIRRCDAVNQSGITSLYCTISVNKTSAVPFSTGIKLIAKNWQPKRKTTNDDQADNIRREINLVESLLRKIKINLQESGNLLTADEIKNKFMEIRNNAIKKPEPKVSFIDMARLFNENKAKKGASCATIRCDVSHLNNIEKYMKYAKKSALGIAEIDLEFIENFTLFFEHKLKNSRNYMNRHIGFINNVLNSCVMKKLINYNPLLSLSLNYENRTDAKGLSSKEVEILEMAIGLNETEQIAVDIFLFMCGTGCDHCDYIKLSSENIINRNTKTLIRYERKKTVTYLKRTPSNGNPIVKECALKVLKKYGSIEQLPKMALNQINENLKRIGENLGIKTKLTTKRGRKTFTNISINRELHTDEQTAYQLGHSTTNQLKHYRRYDEEILKNLLIEII